MSGKPLLGAWFVPRELQLRVTSFRAVRTSFQAVCSDARVTAPSVASGLCSPRAFPPVPSQSLSIVSLEFRIQRWWVVSHCVDTRGHFARNTQVQLRELPPCDLRFLPAVVCTVLGTIVRSVVLSGTRLLMSSHVWSVCNCHEDRWCLGPGTP